VIEEISQAVIGENSRSACVAVAQRLRPQEHGNYQQQQ